MTPTVHVLLYGRVLCGSIHGLPKDWGPGHKWVRIEDRQLATCATCKEVVVTLERENARFGAIDIASPQWVAAVERAWLADNPLLRRQ